MCNNCNLKQIVLHFDTKLRIMSVVAIWFYLHYRKCSTSQRCHTLIFCQNYVFPYQSSICQRFVLLNAMYKKSLKVPLVVIRRRKAQKDRQCNGLTKRDKSTTMIYQTITTEKIALIRQMFIIWLEICSMYLYFPRLNDYFLFLEEKTNWFDTLYRWYWYIYLLILISL
jgi:hypothetical protein